MEIHIRPGRPTELPEIIALQNHALETLCTKDYGSRKIIALVADQANARKIMDELLFVAEAGDQIVGFSTLLKFQSQIGAVYVHPGWVRQGIGTKLVQAVEAIAVQRRIQSLQVMSSLTAVRFYQSQQYQPKYKTGFWTRSKVWIPCIVLEKQLEIANPSHRWQNNLVLVLTVLALLGSSFYLGNLQLQQTHDSSADQIEVP